MGKQSLTARDTDTLNAAKGILIVSVVLGHSRVTSDYVPWLFSFLYLWHVQSFFLLSVIRQKPITWARTKDIAVRYLVPFFWITTLLGVVRMLTGEAPLQRVGDLVQAWIFGSAPYIEKATGASVYWFLPTFFSLAVLTGLIANLPQVRQRWAIAGVIATGLAQALLGWPLGNAMWPLGTGVLFYIAAQCYLFLLVWTILTRKTIWLHAGVILSGLFICVAPFVFVESPPIVNVSLFMWPSSLGLALGTYVLPICVAVLTLYVSRFSGVKRIFKGIGQRSMWIYLFHQFVLFAAWRVMSPLIDESQSLLTSIGFIIIMTVIAISVSTAIGALIWKIPRLKALLLPGTWSEFSLGFRI